VSANPGLARSGSPASLAGPELPSCPT
jgi:hypothetical protein